MPKLTFWRRFSARQRQRISFYETQDAMRAAVEQATPQTGFKAAADDMSAYSVLQLRDIALNERPSPRSAAAIAELEARVARQQAENKAS